MRRAVMWLTSTLVVACTAARAPRPAPGAVDAVAANKDVVCEYVAETGSNIRRKVCIPREQAEAEAEAGEQGLRRLQRNTQRP